MVSNLASHCADQICQLGYEFCEVTKGVCRRCDDFKDTCFVDSQHISNCSTYCKSFQSFNAGREACDTYLTEVIVLVSVLCLLLLVLIAVVIMYFNHKKQFSELNKTVSKSSDTEFSSLQTVSDNTADKHEEESGQNERLLHFQNVQDVPCLGNQPNILKQIPTTNDREDKPQLMVSGKRM